VVKEATASGSQPATQKLGRVRRGMVIGERQVYDVASGDPPTLSNPRTVLLVAVSLHRSYRVFPGDATATTPPRPRRKRKAAAAPVATLALSNNQPSLGATIKLAAGNGAGGRFILPQADLEVLVADAINSRVATGAMFTAYDITLALRDANVAYDIGHDSVRKTVHAQMQAIVASGLYQQESASFPGGTTALRYLPG
jgi:hypothetical protein